MFSPEKTQKVIDAMQNLVDAMETFDELDLIAFGEPDSLKKEIPVSRHAEVQVLIDKIQYLTEKIE